MGGMNMAFAMVVCGAALAAGTVGAAPPEAPSPAPALAEPVTLQRSQDYVLGASVSWSADHVGRAEHHLSLKPLWAFQWGRVKVASGGASGLLGLGRQPVDAGVSTTLLQGERGWLSTALRWDEGRSSSDSVLLRGVPDVRGTLRARVSAGYDLGRRWSVGLTASQDLLGREGGLKLAGSLRYRHPVSARTYWEASLAQAWGNARYMQTQYGLSPTAAAPSGRSAYGVGGGRESVSLGWSLTSAAGPHWVWFAGVGASRLQGAAESSPLVGRKTVAGLTVGLAYRCCQ